MKLIYSFFLFFLLFVSKAMAQTDFFKTYTTPLSLEKSIAIQTNNDNFLVSIMETEPERTKKNGGIIKIDSDTQIIDWKFFNGQDGGSIDYIIKYNTTQNLYIIGGTKDSIASGHLYTNLFYEIINEDLQSIKTQPLLLSEDTIQEIHQMNLVSDSILYILVNRWPYMHGSYFDFFIIKINLNTNDQIIYKPTIKSSVSYDMIYWPKQEKISIFYAGNGADKQASLAKTMELDKDLNYMGYDSLVYGMTYYTDAQIINDSTYMLSSNGYSHYQPFSSCHSMCFYEMDYNNDSIKGCQYYPEHPEDSIIYSFLYESLAKNDESFVVGSVVNIEPFQYPYQQTEATYIQLSFFDYDINMQKQLYYGNGVDVYWPMSIQPTMDGGFVICGAWRKPEITNPPNQDLFLLKVNSEGLITGIEEPEGICASEALVYPNPGGEQFQVKLAAQHQNALLEMYSLNGKMLLSEQLNQAQTTINAQALPQGCYTYRITANGLKIASGKWVKE